MNRGRAAALGVAALLASGIATAPAQAASVGYAKEQAAASQDRHDDAEQRGHVIPDEDPPPAIVRPRPAPPVTPAPPVVAASPVRAESPAPETAPRDELPRTGGDDGLLLLWFGALVAGAGLCLRRAIA